MKHVNCKPGQDVYSACEEQFGDDYAVVTRGGGIGVRLPGDPDMVGTVGVRAGERFTVIPRLVARKRYAERNTTA